MGAEGTGPLMHARIAMLRALNRNVERVFNLAGATLLATTAAQAQQTGCGTDTGSNPNSHPVQGYTAPSGAYVQPHQQTNPNSTQTDNYGTRGNVNPDTGAVGTRNATH
jgi:hypothetical protein